MEEKCRIDYVRPGTISVSVFENEAESKRSDLYGPRGTGRERCLIIEQGCRDDRGQEGKGDKFFFFFFLEVYCRGRSHSRRKKRAVT